MNPKQFLSPAIRYFIAVLFLFSAVVKTMPIQSFELTLVAQGLTDWNLAPILSRIILALELLTGLAFIQKRFLKYLFVPGALLLLLIFNIHLGYMTFAMDGVDNCGCFGQALPMTPFQAIVKNVIMMGMLISLYYLKGSFAEGEKPLQFQLVLPVAVYFILLGFLFILFPMNNSQVIPEDGISASPTDSLTATTQSDSIFTQKIDTLRNKTIQSEKKDTVTLGSLFKRKNSLYSSFTDFVPPQVRSVDDGRVVVGVFSLDCDHCQRAASEIIGFKKIYGKLAPRLYGLFFGSEDQVPEFFSIAGGEFPYMILPPEKFFPLLTSAPPRVTFLINGTIISDMDADGYQKTELEKMIKKYSQIAE